MYGPELPPIRGYVVDKVRAWLCGELPVSGPEFRTVLFLEPSLRAFEIIDSSVKPPFGGFPRDVMELVFRKREVGYPDGTRRVIAQDQFGRTVA